MATNLGNFRKGVPDNPLRCAIFISGSGSGMHALLEYQKQKKDCRHTTVLVVSNNSEAGGIQIAKDLTDRLKIYEDKYQAVGSKILALGKAYNSSVSSYNARLKPSVRNLQKLQGQPQDLMDMENVPVDVTPVIESLEADNEEE